MFVSQVGERIVVTSCRAILVSLFLLLASIAAARAGERQPDPVSRNNLILEGTLPQSALVRVWVNGPGIKETIEHIIPTRGGALLMGIAVPVGEKRNFRFQASNAEDRVLFEGEMQLTVRDGLMKPVELHMKSTLDGSPASVVVASHRLRIEAMGIEAVGNEAMVADTMRVNTKESTLTRIVATLYDADGRVVYLRPDEVQWDINDPWIREHAFPCKGGNGPPPACIQFLSYKPDLTDVVIAACFKEIMCDLEYVPPVPPVWRSVSVGLGHHACALKMNGDAYCWGQGEHGQLGVAVPQSCEEVVFDPNLHAIPWGCSTRPVQVICSGGACNFVAISAGFKHTCAIDTAQDVWCWGSNFRGELGNGTNDNISNGNPHPQRILPGHRFTAISAGVHFTCGLATDKGVYCWGDNSNMIVPNALPGMVLTPTRVNLSVDAVSIDTGFVHACAQATLGRLFCWGSSTIENLLGSDTFAASPFCSNCAAFPRLMQFADIPGLDSKFVDIASAGMHASCAHVTTGDTVCWGQKMPLLGSSPNVDRLAVGGGAYCAVISGTAACAGQGKDGVLGDGSVAFSMRGPVVPLPQPIIYREIDVGITSTCGIGNDDKVYCWGANNFGKVGNGALIEVARPTLIM